MAALEIYLSYDIRNINKFLLLYVCVGGAGGNEAGWRPRVREGGLNPAITSSNKEGEELRPPLPLFVWYEEEGGDIKLDGVFRDDGPFVYDGGLVI